MSTLRFIPVKFPLRWSELLTAIIEGSVTKPSSPEDRTDSLQLASALCALATEGEETRIAARVAHVK